MFDLSQNENEGDFWKEFDNDFGKIRLNSDFKVKEGVKIEQKSPLQNSPKGSNADSEEFKDTGSPVSIEEAVPDTTGCSIRELIDKWGSMVAKQVHNDSEEEEEAMEPNEEFLEAFDGFTSFSKAARFIEDWINIKKHNSTDFANDFPSII